MSTPDSTTPNAAASVTFCVGLPPKELRSNSRAFWAVKVKAKQAYSEEVWDWWHKMTLETPPTTALLDSLPWKRARVTFNWKYAGAKPDLANIPANCKALLDCICMAPNTGLQKSSMTYLGLVENDREVMLNCTLEKVARRAQEGVQITIERMP